MKYLEVQEFIKKVEHHLFVFTYLLTSLTRSLSLIKILLLLPLSMTSLPSDCIFNFLDKVIISEELEKESRAQLIQFTFSTYRKKQGPLEDLELKLAEKNS